MNGYYLLYRFILYWQVPTYSEQEKRLLLPFLDLEMTPLFLAMGIDEISVSPSSILAVRKKVRETNVSMIQNQLFEKWL